MAKKQDAAATPPAATWLSKTFQLARPISDDAGETWSEITVREPELRHRSEALKRKTATEAEQTIVMLKMLTNVPEPALRRMKLRDARAIRAWMEDIVQSAARDDALADAAEGRQPENEAERTFKLLVPIATNAAPVMEIRVVEPDLEAGIAAERMRATGDEDAALLAACCGQIIPVVSRMALRDVARIERWLGFFYGAGVTPETPEKMDELAIGAAGGSSP